MVTDRETLKALNVHIFNNLRILKAKNPGDNYYDEYLKHYAREGDKFYDQYHFAVQWVITHSPKSILEIGTRTGLSICNMLSAYVDYKGIERIVLTDLFNDGFISPEIVKMNMRALNIPKEVMDKTKFIVGDSKTEVPKLEGTFEFVLVDGSHVKEDARKDLENVVRLCAKNGVIVFDDTTDRGCNLQDVWDDFKKSHENEFNFGENHDGKGTSWATKNS